MRYRSKYDAEDSWDTFGHATIDSRPLATELAKGGSCRIDHFQMFGQIPIIYNEIPYIVDLRLTRIRSRIWSIRVI